VPFHVTAAFDTKFEPVTVRVKGPDSVMRVFGVIDVRTGIGLLTVNVRLLEVPPPGDGLVI